MDNNLTLLTNDKKPKKRVSKKQIEANRKNGKLGGPKTEAGKMRIKKNALAHGLLSKAIVVKDYESKSEFDRLLSELAKYYEPHGPVEMMLVEKIAVAWWRLRRVAIAEAGTIIENHKKDYHFEKLNSMLGLKDLESEPTQKDMLPYPQDAMNLLRYETTFERQFYKALDQIERMQRARRGEVVPPPINLNILTNKE